MSELRRFARVRRSAALLALVALVGVLVFGILPGLLVAAGLSLVLVVQRLSRPAVAILARDPTSGAWGRAERHPEWETTAGILVARVEGPLFYANAIVAKERLLALARGADPKPHALVLGLADNHELDIEAADVLAELADALALEGIELRLAAVRIPVLELLRRSGLIDRVRVEPTLESALS